jgi:hypothetical protein
MKPLLLLGTAGVDAGEGNEHIGTFFQAHMLGLPCSVNK